MVGWWRDFVLALSLLTTLPASWLLPHNSTIPGDGPGRQSNVPPGKRRYLGLARRPAPTQRITLRGRPVPGGKTDRQSSKPSSAAGSVRFFPLVGVIIGFILCAADSGLSALFGPILRAALILALDVIITGGLHLDGFIDTCDGLLSRQDRERTLAILRDTHVGGLGTVALVTLLMLKLAVLVEISGELRPWALLLFPLVGRFAMATAVCLFPYARPGAGMGRAYAQKTGRRDWAVALVLSALLLVAVVGYIRPSSKEVKVILLSAVVAVGGSYLVARHIAAKLGGLTGDVYGAVNETAELLFLLAMATSVGFMGQL